MNEHIQFKIGADTKSAETSLKGLNAQAKQAANQFKASFGTLAGAFGFGNIIGKGVDLAIAGIEKLGTALGKISGGGNTLAFEWNIKAGEAALKLAEKLHKIRLAENTQQAKTDDAETELRRSKLTDEELLADLEKEKAKLTDDLAKAQDAYYADFRKGETEALAIREKLAKLTMTIDKTHEDYVKRIGKEAAEKYEAREKEREARVKRIKEHEKEISDLRGKAKDASRNLAAARADFGSMSISEIAGINPQGFNRRGREQIQTAQEVQGVEEQIRVAKLQGSDPRFIDQLIDRSMQLRKSIGAASADERNPLGKLQADAAKATMDLLAAATNTGIVIIPKMGR